MNLLKRGSAQGGWAGQGQQRSGGGLGKKIKQTRKKCDCGCIYCARCVFFYICFALPCSLSRCSSLALSALLLPLLLLLFPLCFGFESRSIAFCTYRKCLLTADCRLPSGRLRRRCRRCFSVHSLSLGGGAQPRLLAVGAVSLTACLSVSGQGFAWLSILVAVN